MPFTIFCLFSANERVGDDDGTLTRLRRGLQYNPVGSRPIVIVGDEEKLEKKKKKKKKIV